MLATSTEMSSLVFFEYLELFSGQCGTFTGSTCEIYFLAELVTFGVKDRPFPLLILVFELSRDLALFPAYFD